jgi:hypothetical protein
MKNIRKNLSNILGWRTIRKFVVFESDDWGSIRTRSKEDYEAMLNKGLDVDQNYFTKYDSLESNLDLENLFSTLGEFNDCTGRPPVFTPMCIVANPDFKRIRDNNCERYYYQDLNLTILDYPKHGNLLKLWRQGADQRLFVPALHGREHLNVERYLKGLNSVTNEGLRIAFDHRSIGASHYKGLSILEYLGAFHPATPDEIIRLQELMEEAISLFTKACGYPPTHFIGPNREPARELDLVLADNGVKYITQSKLRKYPKGNEKYGFEFNWWGKQNKHSQIYLMRNCSFEPSDPSIKDYANRCLTEIENAFNWEKPAIISSHRVNYIGYISPKNAEFGLSQLRYLLIQILKRWPDVEFLTSTELGNIITNKS